MKKYLLIIVTVIVLLVLGFFYFFNQPTTKNLPVPSSEYKTTALVMGQGDYIQTFSAEIADTPALQQLGLSYRKNIGENDAMIFVFPNSGNYQFWMKDMSFPIDIIWLNADKKIIYIEKNLSPSTYPNAFGPNTNSDYVIEVQAGTAARLNLSLGDQISFSCDGYICMR